MKKYFIPIYITLMTLGISLSFSGAATIGGGMIGGGTAAIVPTAIVRPLDWTSSFDSVWNFEEGNISLDEGTSGDNLVNHGPVLTYADSSVQGATVANMTNVDGEHYFSLPDGGNKDWSGGEGSISFACWVKHIYKTDHDGGNELILGNMPNTQDQGYQLYKRVTDNLQHRTAVYNGAFVSASSGVNGTCAAPTCTCTSAWCDEGGITCSTSSDCYYWEANVWIHYGGWIYDHVSSGRTGVWQGGISTQSSTTDTTATVDSFQDFEIGSERARNTVEAYVDECIWDSAQLSITEFCRICSLGVAGQRGECDSGTPANYKPCDTNADCVDNLCVTTATEDNCSPGGMAGCCMGYNDWPRYGLNCNDCDLPACDQTRS